MNIAFPGADLNGEDRYAFTLLNSIIGGDVNSRLFQEIREKNSDVKIIMITAYETIKSVIEIMNIKISGYITKPFIVKDVRERVKKLLEKGE